MMIRLKVDVKERKGKERKGKIHFWYCLFCLSVLGRRCPERKEEREREREREA